MTDTASPLCAVFMMSRCTDAVMLFARFSGVNGHLDLLCVTYVLIVQYIWVIHI